METYLTKAKLKERGWTDGMVKKFLGEPDMKSPTHITRVLRQWVYTI